MKRPFLHRATACYLILQSLGALTWWGILLIWPASRELFRPSEAPDAILLAFWLPDVLLFIGAALWSAYSLIFAPHRALLPLALHVGGAVYAALYCIETWRQTGESSLAALLMAPSLVVAPFLLRLGRVLEREP